MRSQARSLTRTRPPSLSESSHVQSQEAKKPRYLGNFILFCLNNCQRKTMNIMPKLMQDIDVIVMNLDIF